MRLFHRLRTQLIVSHLIAIACTLIAMVSAVVLIAGSWFASQRSALNEPALEAQAVANMIEGLVTSRKTSQDLNVVLRALADGELRLPATTATSAPWAGQRQWTQELSLLNVKYIVVISPAGDVLASSQPTTGTSFTPVDRQEWNGLLQAALGASRDPRKLTRLQPGTQPAAFGAYPVLDASGRPLAVVILASQSVPPNSGGSTFWHSLLFAGEASAALLAGSSVFALVSAGLVGYLLSRRLVLRLEHLGQAAERLSEGDLDQRVDEGNADEVGQLANRFNIMAARLAETVKSLTAARDRTESALTAKRELVANVSHELRTPLALIRGYVESLAMPATDADPVRRREYLAVVERETENLSRLIDDLFTLSTAEAGVLPLNLGPVDIGEIIKEMGDSLGPLAYRERQITIANRIPAKLPPVTADHQRLVQILGNLIRNSLRHTPEGGLIGIRAEQQGGWITVSVEDTGEGIPLEHLAHIFERFYRGDTARDRGSGGAGLGLAIVRELVEAMGGDVAVESQVGQGSKFSFRLHLAKEAVTQG